MSVVVVVVVLMSNGGVRNVIDSVFIMSNHQGENCRQDFIERSPVVVGYVFCSFTRKWTLKNIKKKKKIEQNYIQFFFVLK